MPYEVKVILVLLYAYLVSAVPMAYIMGRALKGIDIRQYGSGNAGTSNVWVHISKKAVLPVGLFDVIVKGASSVWLARYGFDLGLGAQALCGFAAVIGHNWSVYLRFSGGRGIATSMGVLFALSYKALLPFAIVGLVGWLITRNSAFWMVISIFILPFWALFLGEPLTVVLFCIGLLLVTAIKRLLANMGGLPEGSPWVQVMKYRLLYDRDILSREEWVNQKPD